MKKYLIDDYKFITNDKRIIAITHDAGKTIKASATCASGDKFDEKYGKELAASRANLKVMIRKKKRAEKAVLSAEKHVYEAEKERESAKNFYKDAIQAYEDAINELESIEKENK